VSGCVNKRRNVFSRRLAPLLGFLNERHLYDWQLLLRVQLVGLHWLLVALKSLYHLIGLVFDRFVLLVAGITSRSLKGALLLGEQELFEECVLEIENADFERHAQLLALQGV